MRLYLKLTYVLSRDEELGVWVGWCPEVDTMSQGYSIDTALWMIRQAVRMTIENEVKHSRHPYRWAVKDSEDSDFLPYKEYRRASDDDDYSFCQNWESVHRGHLVPESINIVFATSYMSVSTLAGDCLIDEPEIGQISYKRGKWVKVRMLVETDYTIDSLKLGEEVTLEAVRKIYGPEVKEILSVEDADY